MGKTGVARFAVVLIIVLGGCSFQGAIETETVPVSPNDTGIHRVTEKAPETEPIAVLQVIDGDTCRLEDVRYLGINAPEEGDPHAEEATLANRRLVEGKTVRLEFGRSRQDKYDRLPAYVFVDDA